MANQLKIMILSGVREQGKDMFAVQVNDEIFVLDAGFVCTIRQTRGDDIDAACGQLVGQVADRTRRAEQWKKKIAQSNEIMRSQG